MTSPDPSSQPAPPVVGYIVRQQTSTMAVVSMILGILGFLSMCCSFGVPSMLAVILGHAALKETSSGEKDGHAMAITGLVLGYIIAIPALIFSVIWSIGMVGSHSARPTP